MDRREYLQRAREFSARGSALPHSKLTPDTVSWIRENRQGLPAKTQAEILGVHINTIYRARNGATWVHVDD